jgi:integrating conjugative element membrane protein (TIGR03747 family)
MSDPKSNIKSTSHSVGLWAMAMKTLGTTFFVTAAAGCFLSLVWGIRSWREQSTAEVLNQIDTLLATYSWESFPKWIDSVANFYRNSRTSTLLSTTVCWNRLAVVDSNAFSKELIQICSEFKNQILPLLCGIAAVLAMRLWILITALPLWILSLSIGFVDGLVQRDIRKHQGARESALLFHRIKRFGPVIFFIPLFAYLAWLSPCLPLCFFIPIATVMGFWLAYSLRYFKKYI